MSKSAGLRWMLPRAADGVILLCPPCLYLMVLVVATQRGGMGFDFHVFWEASRAVAHGQSPYDPEGLAEMRRVAQADLSVPFPNTAWAVYPPALYTLLVPLGLLPWPAAAALGMTLLAVTPALALRVMGVRDWRCYCLAYGSPPIFTSVVLGTISTALMLGFALVWRGRGVLVAGGSTVVAKLFLWPVAIAVAVSDGSRRALTLLAAAAACAVGSWAVIGFEDIDRYPQMLSDLSAAEAHNSFSTTGFAFALGLPLKVGVYVGLALGVTVIAFAFRAGLRGRRDAAFSLVLVAALLMSPIVWMHYLSLAFLPLAARYPRFNVFWLLPLILWTDWNQAVGGDAWQYVAIWAYIAVLVSTALRSAPPRTVLVPAFGAT